MQLARVIGTVVATIKSPGLDGVKLLVIQPLDRQLKPVGGQLVAADAVHMAGPGELVYFVAAREAAQAMPDRQALLQEPQCSRSFWRSRHWAKAPFPQTVSHAEHVPSGFGALVVLPTLPVRRLTCGW